MQVLKKINIILLCLLFCNCSFMQKSDSQSFFGWPYVGRSAAPVKVVESTDYSHVDLGNAESFRVAMLLPLSGPVSAMGQNMKNAAMMAVGDINNEHLVLQFYDTKGTSSGARVAFENAMNAHSRLILGPLLADEVAAISSEAKARDIPVVSFSTLPAVLQDGIYSLGILNDDQIKNIIRFAAGQGRKRIAAVLPDNQSGLNMFTSLMRAARRNGVQLTKVGFYRPDSMDFTSLVTSMTGSSSKTSEHERDFGFDALLVPESGNRLKSITSMFSYYDVSAPQVLFMGTSVWANTGLSKETELYGAVYPVVPLSRLDNFNQKYAELFASRPNGLSVFAYDAVMMASALSTKNPAYLKEEIVRTAGYNGMSGTFRILPNGLNEHGLDIVRVTSGGEQIVESAQNRFYGTAGEDTDYIDNAYAYEMPIIYGKDSNALRQIMYGMQ